MRVLVRTGSDRSTLTELPVAVEVGGLDSPAVLDRAVAGVSRIYHCAGRSADWGLWRDFAQANVDGTANVVSAAVRAGTVERLLHVSTTDVYGYPVRPCDETTPVRDVGLPYNCSKLRGEQAVAAAADATGLPVTIVRPATIYGPRSKDFAVELARLLQRRQLVYIAGGTRRAGLLYVTNAVDAMIAACHSGATVGRAYNLRDPEPTTWREYIGGLAAGLGLTAPTLSIPVPVALGVARLCEAAHGASRREARPLLTRHAVRLFGTDQFHSVDRARHDFGFTSAVSTEKGVVNTVAWLSSPQGRARADVG